ncbi:MAG: class I SAM-dependent methyltransferase [Spirochaetia bacterium]|jgi:SAM-dependent methyltransferase|nr:class I SAM-dependent methyltransferase [Spirochaetia bacterium]
MKLYHQLAEYYFAIESNSRNIFNDIDLIRSQVSNIKRPQLLDLGCGTGEHLSYLAKSGFECTGIDNSDDMIRIGSSRFPEKIEFIRTDMRDIKYRGDFDIVTSLFGSMNYLVDDADMNRVFRNIYAALKDNSIALLEIWNSYPVSLIKKKPISKVSVTKYAGSTIERERGFHIMENEGGKTIVEVDYRYVIRGERIEDVLTDKHIMRSFSPEEINPFIVDNGFTIKAIYANSLKEAFQNVSNRMFLVLHKK